MNKETTKKIVTEYANAAGISDEKTLKQLMKDFEFNISDLQYEEYLKWYLALKPQI